MSATIRPESRAAIRRIRENGIYILPNSFTIAALFSAFFAIPPPSHGNN